MYQFSGGHLICAVPGIGPSENSSQCLYFDISSLIEVNVYSSEYIRKKKIAS